MTHVQEPRGSETHSLSTTFVKLLVKAGAQQRSADIFVELRGLAGEQPRSLRSVARGLSAERIRQLMGELEKGGLQALLVDKGEPAAQLRQDLATALRRIEAHAPGSDDDIRNALAAEFDPLDTAPASIIRMADIMGVHHKLRLTTWTERAKFADEERTQLASVDSGHRRESVCGIVPDDMPELFENFINFARKFSRGAGVVAAGQLASRYGVDRGVAIAPNEAVAFLRPFAVHLGRHDGDDWFAFFNSANDFIRKATTRVELFGHGSFEQIRQFHQRFNRSLYADEETVIPESVLKAALELAGYHLVGDDITPMKPLKGQTGRGISDIQAQMVKVFRETLARTPGRKSVRRAELVNAMLEAGIRESTARVYLGNQGLFECKGGLCRLADRQATAEDLAEVAIRGRGRGRPAGTGKSKSSVKGAPIGLNTGATYPAEA